MNKIDLYKCAICRRWFDEGVRYSFIIVYEDDEYAFPVCGRCVDQRIGFVADALYQLARKQAA